MDTLQASIVLFAAIMAAMPPDAPRPNRDLRPGDLSRMGAA